MGMCVEVLGRVTGSLAGWAQWGSPAPCLLGTSGVLQPLPRLGPLPSPGAVHQVQPSWVGGGEEDDFQGQETPSLPFSWRGSYSWLADDVTLPSWKGSGSSTKPWGTFGHFHLAF